MVIYSNYFEVQLAQFYQTGKRFWLHGLRLGLGDYLIGTFLMRCTCDEIETYTGIECLADMWHAEFKKKMFPELHI